MDKPTYRVYTAYSYNEMTNTFNQLSLQGYKPLGELKINVLEEVVYKTSQEDKKRNSLVYTQVFVKDNEAE